MLVATPFRMMADEVTTAELTLALAALLMVMRATR
jgi:hypothetical protein